MSIHGPYAWESSEEILRKKKITVLPPDFHGVRLEIDPFKALQMIWNRVKLHLHVENMFEKPLKTNEIGY